MFRVDILGAVDILSGVLVYLTSSFIPSSIALTHTAILLTKGFGGFIKPVKFPFPVYVIGGMADMLSAAILFTGTPLILVAYKEQIAALLMLKGFWTLFSLMK